ncbi:hypothetical protein MNBD_NITROSPINAE01-577 [hydrothermal vent metagenome]|uniref:Zinc-ribbon domain-containing protein n=1 Tax=hydrothermal vent metagenome TaxID=652676 RepID=A0A3B1BK75_9ZZZZ
MITFIELALLVAVMFVVAYPLMKSALSSESGEELLESDLSDLLYKKDAAYIALKDLDFDYKTGKIDDEDYQEMKGRFEFNALAALKEIEDYKKGEWVPNTPQNRVCPKCGAKALESHKFCTQCGTPITENA